LLRADILARGILVPVEQDEHGAILDGHHRLAAYRELEREGHTLPPYPVMIRAGLTEAQKRAHVRALNLARRSLTATQRRALIAEQLRDAPSRSDRSVATDLAVSPTTVAMVRRRLRANEATVHSGQLSGDEEVRVGRDGRRRRVPSMRTVVAPSAERASRARLALERIPPEALPARLLSSDELNTAARLVEREGTREARLAALRPAKELEALGGGPFNVILADPPWRYEGASDPTRTADNHYRTMGLAELAALPISAVVARQAVLFLWTTPPKLAEAVALVDSWGFLYRTSAVWDKAVAGLGSWFRQEHELLLVATRGGMVAPAPSTRPPSVIRARRGRHSAKPAKVHEIIEQMYPGVARLELFARAERPSWTCWGNEIPERAQAG
jgi:N6-adenosine-specific RNA methylase IME4/ParB-like chromosome segregation protein Spo0J